MKPLFLGSHPAMEWAGDWISRWRDAPGGNYETELRRLNRLLERAKGYREVVVNKNRMQVMERCRIDSADELIALPAAQVAFLIATEQPSRDPGAQAVSTRKRREEFSRTC